jgi:sugar lactone lactonase YvrE
VTPATTPAPTLPPDTPVPTVAAPTDTPPPAGALVELVAGGGAQPPAVGTAATDAALQRTSGAAVAPDGSMWITDVNLSMLIHVGTDGTILEVISGLTGPEGVAVGSDGTVFFADRASYRVMKVNPDGSLERVAGTEFNAGFRGDGGPARRALLFQPYDVAIAASGPLFIADSANQRIRVVQEPGPTIDTVVGTGEFGFSGDGGPGTAAQIYGPQAIAMDEAGQRLLIADTTNQRLRALDLATQTISTIAGSGTNAVNYDPNLTGPQTPITRIAALAADGDGNAYFTVFWGDLGNVVMRLAPDGTMTRVLGGGTTQAAGVSALEFALPDVLGLAVDLHSNALLVCGSDGRVWRLPDVVAEQ